jgi:hypothetical protein
MVLREELRRHLKPAVMVGGALIGSLVLYLGLVEALRAALRPFRGFAAGGGGQPVRYAAFGAAAAVILFILVLRRRFDRSDRREDDTTALRRLQNSSILTLVLGEIPAVLGLGLFLYGGGASDFYKLFFASLLLTFINFPRASAWEEWLGGSS